MATNGKTETVLGWLLMLLAYCVVGIIIGAIMDITGEIQDTHKDIATVMLLWPLFVIKYLVLGIWVVLSNGWELLI